MLLGYIWLLGTFVNSSCNIKRNIKIVQNCCRNLAIKRLKPVETTVCMCGAQLLVNWLVLHCWLVGSVTATVKLANFLP